MARNALYGMGLTLAVLPALIAASACHPDASAQDRNDSTAMATSAASLSQSQPTDLLEIDPPQAAGRWRWKTARRRATCWRSSR
jgi:hypothetical protein